MDQLNRTIKCDCTSFAILFYWLLCFLCRNALYLVWWGRCIWWWVGPLSCCFSLTRSQAPGSSSLHLMESCEFFPPTFSVSLIPPFVLLCTFSTLQTSLLLFFRLFLPLSLHCPSFCSIHFSLPLSSSSHLLSSFPLPLSLPPPPSFQLPVSFCLLTPSLSSTFHTSSLSFLSPFLPPSISLCPLFLPDSLPSLHFLTSLFSLGLISPFLPHYHSHPPPFLHPPSPFRMSSVIFSALQFLTWPLTSGCSGISSLRRLSTLGSSFSVSFKSMHSSTSFPSQSGSGEYRYRACLIGTCTCIIFLYCIYRKLVIVCCWK